jgi:hypothetical protein
MRRATGGTGGTVRYSVEEAGAAIRATIAAGRLPRLNRRGMPAADSQFATVYSDGFIPVWITAEGKPNPAAREALAILGDADTEGLRPEDYQAERLDTMAAALERAPSPDAGEIGECDATLPAAVLRFADLHGGRWTLTVSVRDVAAGGSAKIAADRRGDQRPSRREAWARFGRRWCSTSGSGERGHYRALVDSGVPRCLQ